ncbi:O-antigen ligase family protein [Reinekea sp.]|jgi:putative inorganic carbon (HCO3(-)) transporter|uniref:O-antigen ligase family protein n=1 Tax=Reinekea sp. TaxID=1970455 RepID=UPI0039892AF7
MAKAKPEDFKVEDFYFLKIKTMWRYFWSEHPAFWCACGFLFFEYFRPQTIYPAIDILPWSQLFILGALGLSILDKKSFFKINYPTVLIVLFFLQIELSRFFAYYPEWSSKNHIQFFQWIIVFFVVTITVTTRERFYIFIIIFLLCTLKISIGTSKNWAMRGFGFTSWGLMGPQGYFQNSGELAIQMLLLVALGFYLIKVFWSNSNRWEKFILALMFITPIMTIMGASSRGSQLALGILLFIFYWRRLYSPKVLAIIAFLFSALLFLLPDEQKDRFSNMGEDGTSVQRLLYWENGIEMIKEHPFTGVGLYNFIPYYTDVYPDDINFTNQRGERVAELPHNIFVQVGTDGGIPALLIYCLFIIFCIIPKKKEDPVFDNIRDGLSKGVLAFVIAGQFVSVAYYPFLWVSYAVMAAHKNIKNVNKTHDRNET